MEPPARPAAGEANGLGHGLGRMSEAVLEIAGDGTGADGHDEPRVGQRLLARHLSVELAERRGARRARGGERLESERLHDGGGASVPDVRDDEGSGALMERAKALRVLALTRHGRLLPPGQRRALRSVDSVTPAGPAATLKIQRLIIPLLAALS